MRRRSARSLVVARLITLGICVGVDPSFGSTAAIDELRVRAAAAVIDCLFAPACGIGDFNGDSALSVADVLVAQQLPQANPAEYARIIVTGDPSATGVFDASLSLPHDSDIGWMAYSGVDYRQDGGFLVRDVTTRLASTPDGGRTWQMRAPLNPPAPATITVGDASLCGASQCDGRLISEIPFMFDDASDPEAQRRFKLLAHRYFVYPPAAAIGRDLQHPLGSINLRTAPAPDGPWSTDAAVLGWNLTAPEIDPVINVNQLDGMENCLALSEGDAKAFGNELDVVFTCPHFAATGIRQRIVLLRSADHLASLAFVATLLDDADAAALGANDLSAPSLFTIAGRTYLLITPVTHSSTGAQYAGCMVIAFADRAAGQLERDGHGDVIIRQLLPTDEGRFGGACAWDPRAAGGIVMSQLFFEGTMPSFRLFDTGVSVIPAKAGIQAN